MALQSLHSHTFDSDGKFTHQQVLDLAQKYGISVIAFTDHDVLPDLETLEELKKLNHPVKWLTGIEISAGLPKELGESSEGGPHVIGLFTDPTNKALQTYCKKSQEGRIEGMKMTVKKWQQLGFDITPEDCLRQANGPSVGRPHIVAALVAKETNLHLIKDYMEQMRKAGENDAKTHESYQLMLQQGESQYPYRLFLGDEAFKPTKVSNQYWVDLDQAVKLIREA